MPSNLRSPLSFLPNSRLARVARCSVLCCLLALPAMATAAALGDAVVRSSLGQALDVDIAIASLSAAETDSLIVRPAPASAYANAEIDYTPLLRSLRVFVEKRGEQTIVRVTSDLPVNDPFVRLLVELGASGSRTIREYTLLVDPPAIGEPAAKPLPDTAAPAAAAAPERPADTQASRPADATASDRHIVRRGDTLRTIGASLQPDGVRLEQVLVALQAANPDAFVGRNINRLKRGSVLRVPDADTMRAVDPAQALRSVRAQAADFARYRQSVAQAAARAPARAAERAPAIADSADSAAPPGNRSSSAQVGTLAEAPSPPAPAQDKLTLSVPGRNEQADSRPGSVDAAERIADDKALVEANERIAALEKNIGQLQQMLEVRDEALANAQQRAAEAPPAAAVAPAPPPAAPPAPATLPPPQGAADTQRLMAALDDPFARAGAAALLLLLAAWAGLRRRRRRPPPEGGQPVEPVLAPTVIGGAGGRHVDTRHSEFHSNFVPSVSQIDANEVDAVAEADVYIAYGRDEQAEEILLDALRAHPERDALRVKLLEIHAARKDRQKFGALAAELRVRTHGSGSEWERAAQLGRQLDPGNLLYEIAAAGVAAASAAAAPTPTPAPAPAPALTPTPTTAAAPDAGRPYAAPPEPPPASPVEDFSLRLEGLLEERRHDEDRPPPQPPQPEAQPAPSIDFRLEGMEAAAPPAASSDEAALGTKLDLAQACRDIGDHESARELLIEVVRSGHPEFARRAQSLLDQLA